MTERDIDDLLITDDTLEIIRLRSAIWELKDRCRRQKNMLEAQANELRTMHNKMHDALHERHKPFQWAGSNLLTCEARAQRKDIRCDRMAMLQRIDKEMLVNDKAHILEDLHREALRRVIAKLDESGALVCEKKDYGPYLTFDYHIDVARLDMP